MAQAERFDLLVFGGGKGGKTLAMDLARAGRRVAMVERGYVGGSCINVACIPTKTLIRSARVAALARHASSYGVGVGEVRVEMAGVRSRKRAVVAGMVEANRSAFVASGMDFILGEGKFVAPKTLEVQLAGGGARLLTADQVVINTGSRALVPDTPGLAAAAPLTNVEALELDVVPEHLIVLGGGYIGMEMAQAFRRFGSRVTMLERGPQIAPREDPDVSAELLRLFREEEIDVRLGTSVVSVSGRSGDGVEVRLRSADGETTLRGSHLLAATGRVPNTAGIGLDAAGVGVTERGFVRVNERLETTAPGVWAVGDVAGSPQFTHVSLDDYRVVKANLEGGDRTTKGRLVPYTVFLDPELGRVGLNKSEAKKQGLSVRVARLPLAAVPRARTLGETRGFLEAVVAADSDRVLGFTMLGPEAGEVTSIVQVAMLGGVPYPALRDAIFSHPTLGEALNLLFANVA